MENIIIMGIIAVLWYLLLAYILPKFGISS
jgi:hypothetical protein